MRFSTIFAPLSLLGLAAAAAGRRTEKGIPYDTAVQIVNDFVSTLTAFDVNVATNLLAPSFVDFSDSINFLIGAPAGSPTFPSPQAYIAGQGAQPPIGLDILAIDAITSYGVIVFRWTAHVGLEVAPANGISVLYATQSGPDPTVVGPGGYQLGRLYSEFNSAAWVLDIGGSVTLPPPPASS